MHTRRHAQASAKKHSCRSYWRAGERSVRANHVKIPKGTPLANLVLGLMDRYGLNVDKFGDSTAEIDLLTV